MSQLDTSLFIDLLALLCLAFNLIGTSGLFGLKLWGNWEILVKLKLWEFLFILKNFMIKSLQRLLYPVAIVK